MSIEKAKAFVGYTSYMKLSIDEVSSVVIEGKYDGYTFGKVANLVINTSYSGIKADELTKKLRLNTPKDIRIAVPVQDVLNLTIIQTVIGS